MVLIYSFFLLCVLNITFYHPPFHPFLLLSFPSCPVISCSAPCQGMELYPRIGKYFDIKTFTNCRFGMMSWALLIISFAVKQVWF